MEKLYELALFAGGGGGLLGSKLLGWRTVCYVENNPYAVEIIKARIRDGMLDDAPIWDDVRTFDGRPWAGRVDIVTAGFPCQPWSAAGKHQGEHDKRNLWPETIRIIREVEPEWCLLENVPNLLSRSYVQQIFSDLAESGYDIRWDCIPAAAVGAPHLRYRLWIVAHAAKQHRSIDGQKAFEPGWSGEDVSNAEHNQILHNQLDKKKNEKLIRFDRWYEIEPDVGMLADGVAHRMDQIRALGNGQVPGVVRVVWMLLARDLE